MMDVSNIADVERISEMYGRKSVIKGGKFVKIKESLCAVVSRNIEIKYKIN